MLLKLLRLQLQAESAASAHSENSIAAAHSAGLASYQGGLFLPASPDPEKLELTVARIANLVGETNIGSPN